MSDHQTEWMERLRTGYERFNSGDFDGVLEFLHPAVEWHRPAMNIESGVLRGRDELRALMTPDVFTAQEIVPDEIRMQADKIWVAATFRARGRASGIEVENAGYQVWTVRDGLALRVELFDDRASSLAAAGL